MTDHKWVYPPLKAAWEIRPDLLCIVEELERDAVIHAALEWIDARDDMDNRRDGFANVLDKEDALAATLRPLANRRAMVGPTPEVDW